MVVADRQEVDIKTKATPTNYSGCSKPSVGQCSEFAVPTTLAARCRREAQSRDGEFNQRLRRRRRVALHELPLRHRALALLDPHCGWPRPLGSFGAVAADGARAEPLSIAAVATDAANLRKRVHAKGPLLGKLKLDLVLFRKRGQPLALLLLLFERLALVTRLISQIRRDPVEHLLEIETAGVLLIVEHEQPRVLGLLIR